MRERILQARVAGQGFLSNSGLVSSVFFGQRVESGWLVGGRSVWVKVRGLDRYCRRRRVLVWVETCRSTPRLLHRSTRHLTGVFLLIARIIPLADWHVACQNFISPSNSHNIDPIRFFFLWVLNFCIFFILNSNQLGFFSKVVDRSFDYIMIFFLNLNTKQRRSYACSK